MPMECWTDLPNQIDKSMKKIVYLIVIITSIGCSKSNYLQSEMVQLSAPRIDVSNTFFEEEILVTIADTKEDAYIQYALSAGKKSLYKETMIYTRTEKIEAVARSENYIDSEVTSVDVVKLPKYKVNSISSNRTLSEKYNTGGLDILIDRQKGEIDFNKGWLGYGGDTIDYNVVFDNMEVKQVVVSFLRNQKSWIFAPEKLEVYDKKELIATQVLVDVLSKNNDGFVLAKIPIDRVNTDSLSIKIIASKGLPDWHPGVGGKPWIFVDEILIY